MTEFMGKHFLTLFGGLSLLFGAVFFGTGVARHSEPDMLNFAGFGLLFFCIGGVLTYLESKKRRRVRRLLAEGRAVTAEVLKIYQDDSITLRSGSRRRRFRKHPYRILCSWTNPADGARLEFKSDELWRHPGEPATVTVYINPADLREYHVAVD